MLLFGCHDDDDELVPVVIRHFPPRQQQFCGENAQHSRGFELERDPEDRSSNGEGVHADCKDAKKVWGWEAGWNEASAWTQDRHLLLPPVP